MTKTKPTKQTNELAIKDWLRKNDQKLYTKRVLITNARKRCEADLGGGKISPRMFKRLRTQACTYWKIKSAPSYSSNHVLDWKQWDRFRQWCLSNSSLLPKCSSIEFAARLMRHDGILASPELLKNSCSFMYHWKASR